MTAKIAQLLSITLGAATGGALFTLAHRGDISWWIVVLVLAWVFSFGVQSFVVGREADA